MKNYTKTMIDRTWFSRLLRHPARKLSGSILTTPELAYPEKWTSKVIIASSNRSYISCWSNQHV